MEIKKLLIPALISAAFTGCGGGSSSAPVQPAASETVDDVNSTVMLKILQSSNPAITNAFGYKAVKITYPTTTPEGKEVNASGILVIPEATDDIKAKFGGFYPISLVVDNHGTIFLDEEAPSNVEKSDGIPNLPTAVLFTGAYGFATLLPDGLGYGVSKGNTHPYIMKYSAKASEDMIKAAAKYLQDNNYTFTNDVYITGYSEGGYVAMAMSKEMQEENSSFNIKASAPMAGPYDIEKLALYDLNDSNKMVFPAFLAFIADSYSKIYDLSLDEAVVKPDVFKTYDLFGGDYNFTAIHYYLGLVDFETGDYGFYSHYPHDMFTQEFLTDFQTNPSNPFREKFVQNNIYAWTPKMPMNIINCVDDEIIFYPLAQEANATMHALADVNVTLTPIQTSEIPPKTDSQPFVHQRCATTAYQKAAEFFQKVRGY